MRAERRLVLIITALAAACNKAPAISPVPSVTPPPESLPKIEPFVPTGLPEEVQNHAGANFLKILKKIEKHPDERIHPVADKLRSARERGVVVYVSVPSFDELGNLSDPPRDMPAIACNYDQKADFYITIVSNLYYNPDSISSEATAAMLEECLLFQEGVNQRHQEFSKQNPNISLLEALNRNPRWIEDSSIDAWYLATGNIIAPYREKMPKNDSLLAALIRAHDTCDIDFTQHEGNPLKANQDQKCWRDFFNIRIDVQA